MPRLSKYLTLLLCTDCGSSRIIDTRNDASHTCWCGSETLTDLGHMEAMDTIFDREFHDRTEDT